MIFSFLKNLFGGKKCAPCTKKPHGQSIGSVVHYYDNIGVAIIDVTGTLKKGDKITFYKGDKTYSQHIDSMQVDHKDVEEARAGDSVGVKVRIKVKDGTEVWK